MLSLAAGAPRAAFCWRVAPRRGNALASMPASSAAAGTTPRKGIVYGLFAYTIWGLFPLYFKTIEAPPIEALAQRALWSALFLAALFAAQRRFAPLLSAVRQRGVALRSLLSASLLATNWFIYIWAVMNDRVVDASLGYFITPLVNVAIGVLVLREPLRPGQVVAVALAAVGVLWLTLQFGEPPWVGLALAATFGTYGALRKTGALGSLDGLMLEQALLFPAALVFLGFRMLRGESAWLAGDGADRALLASTGPVTVLPLWLFAAGARLIPLSLVGLLQYIAPTLQLLLGVLLWHEPFSRDKVAGYALIWLALVLYSLEGAVTARLRTAA